MFLNIREFLYYVKPNLIYFIISFIAVLSSALIILFFGKSISNIIDSNIIDTSFVTKLMTIIFIVFGISFTSFIRLYFIGIGSEKVISKIRYSLYSNFIDLQPSFFENEKISIQDIISSLITDTCMLQSIISGSLLTILRNFITLIGSIFMLLYIDFYLTLYASVIIPVLLITIIFFGRKVRSYTRFVQNSINELASISEESFRSIITIKSFVSEENEKIKFKKQLKLISNLYIKLIFFKSILITIIIFFVIGSLVILIFFGIKEVLNNNITIGELSSFIFYSAIAAGAISNISENINELQRGFLIIERLFKLRNIKSSIINVNNPIKILYLKKEISFNNITFFYKFHENKEILKNVTFSIKAGQKVLIVGPSGSGKSTILKLLLRFYDPKNGIITIDDHNIKSIELKNLRSLFSLVPQNQMMFSCSIMDNILYGKPDAKYEEVKQAAIDAYAMEFIQKLPNKFETIIGEIGLKLSEGQKQRILIARAILKNPQILVLDEATSSLDYGSENFVQKALNKLMKNRTTIIVTHKILNTLKTDKIIVINNGKIEETGTHESLMNKNGLYAKLVKIQWESYNIKQIFT